MAKNDHLQGGRQALGDQVDHLLVPLQRAAQIPLDGIAQPVQVPEVIGLVQAQFGADRRHRVLLGPDAEHHPHRVARAEIDQGRDQHGHQEEDRDENQQSAKDEFEQNERPSLDGFEKVPLSRPERGCASTLSSAASL